MCLEALQRKIPYGHVFLHRLIDNVHGNVSTILNNAFNDIVRSSHESLFPRNKLNDLEISSYKCFLPISLFKVSGVDGGSHIKGIFVVVYPWYVVVVVVVVIVVAAAAAAASKSVAWGVRIVLLNLEVGEEGKQRARAYGGEDKLLKLSEDQVQALPNYKVKIKTQSTLMAFFIFA
ncbi:hypothetical protein Tco_0180822, partial [Tanacetum coccineum]